MRSTSRCPFAYSLGTPGHGVHAARIFGLARNDIIGTILVAILTSYIWEIALWKSLLGWFLAGEILHYAFGTPTAFLRWIGLTPRC